MRSSDLYSTQLAEWARNLLWRQIWRDHTRKALASALERAPESVQLSVLHNICVRIFSTGPYGGKACRAFANVALPFVERLEEFYGNDIVEHLLDKSSMLQFLRNHLEPRSVILWENYSQQSLTMSSLDTDRTSFSSYVSLPSTPDTYVCPIPPS